MGSSRQPEPIGHSLNHYIPGPASGPNLSSSISDFVDGRGGYDSVAETAYKTESTQVPVLPSNLVWWRANQRVNNDLAALGTMGPK
jgi:hypothetical protein